MLSHKNYTKKFIFVASFLVFLIPYAQISGPFITDFFISILAIMYIFTIILLNRDLHQNNFFLNILIVFWLYISTSALINDYSSLSLRPSLTFVRFILFSYVIIFLCKNNKNFYKNFNIFLISALLILTLDGYIQFIFGKNILGYEQIRPDRLSGLFIDELILGSFLSKFLPIIIFFYYENIEHKKIKILNLLIIATIIPLIFLSGERAAFFMSILFCLIILPVVFTIKKLLITLVIFMISSFIIINSNSIVHDRYVNQLKDHLILKNNGKILLFPEHIGLFNSAYENFKNNKITGSGVKSFRETCKLNNSDMKKKIIEIRPRIDFCSTHPHNYYLQFLSETGLIGFSLIFLSLIYCMKNYLKFTYLYLTNKLKDRIAIQKYIILLSGLIIILWPITTTGNFFNNWNSSLVFLQLSFFLSYINENKFKNKI